MFKPSTQNVDNFESTQRFNSFSILFRDESSVHILLEQGIDCFLPAIGVSIFERFLPDKVRRRKTDEIGRFSPARSSWGMKMRLSHLRSDPMTQYPTNDQNITGLTSKKSSKSDDSPNYHGVKPTSRFNKARLPSWDIANLKFTKIL